MKIYELLAIVLIWLGSVLAAGFVAMNYKEASMIAERAKISEAVEDTRKRAMEGAADAISKITVRNTTIQGRVDTIIKDNTVYRDCQHAPDVMRNINEVLTGRTGRDSDSGVSRTVTPE